MKDKGPDVRATKIDEQRDAGVGIVGIAVPGRNLDHVEELVEDARSLHRVVGFKVVLRLHQEVHLVEVELVVLQSVILDGPLFHRSLSCGDRRRSVGIEDLLRLALHSHEELLCGLVLVEVDQARGGDRC
jgi:hypothetical protein